MYSSSDSNSEADVTIPNNKTKLKKLLNKLIALNQHNLGQRQARNYRQQEARWLDTSLTRIWTSQGTISQYLNYTYYPHNCLYFSSNKQQYQKPVRESDIQQLQKQWPRLTNCRNVCILFPWFDAHLILVSMFFIYVV